MSEEETMAPTPSRHRMARSLTLTSEDGHEDADMSINLLDEGGVHGGERRGGAGGGLEAPEGVLGQGQEITRAIKRALEPMMAELVTVKKLVHIVFDEEIYFEMLLVECCIRQKDDICCAEE